MDIFFILGIEKSTTNKKTFSIPACDTVHHRFSRKFPEKYDCKFQVFLPVKIIKIQKKNHLKISPENIWGNPQEVIPDKYLEIQPCTWKIYKHQSALAFAAFSNAILRDISDCLKNSVSNSRKISKTTKWNYIGYIKNLGGFIMGYAKYLKTW